MLICFCFLYCLHEIEGLADITRRAVVFAAASTVYDLCPKEKFCASTIDDTSNGGKNFVEPWTYDDNDYHLALDRLMTVLGSDVVKSDDRFIVARRKGLWGEDYFEFYCTPNDNTIQIRVLADSPLPSERLDKIRINAAFDKLDVLRNRRRAFGIFTSPFDSFGPSLLEQSSTEDLTSLLRDADPLSPNFQPPDKNTRKWIRESRQAEF
mmetsp:Transcript_4795/g.7209  ORF Transcript_4795/g.7209 Transcript_4795/m.7209 type:complete len:209 (+) Transcript_4795:245-871(+)